MKTAVKAGLGAVVSIIPKCNFTNAIFILGHMRCGSTALSNILCSRPEISGYGEAHIRYDNKAALGMLLVNQWKHGGARLTASYLFDKILHNQYDAKTPDQFEESRQIMVVRRPRPTIASIRNLFSSLASPEYASDEACADYFESRVESILRRLERPCSRRCLITHETLIESPEKTLNLISLALQIEPPLVNRYDTNMRAMRPGAGDPLRSVLHNKIVAVEHGKPSFDQDLELPNSRLELLDTLYLEYVSKATPLARS